jgi:hypothetical protein
MQALGQYVYDFEKLRKLDVSFSIQALPSSMISRWLGFVVLTVFIPILAFIANVLENYAAVDPA